MIGMHCIAHRLALCSSQAADKVSYLKQYQQILSDIFYHFKRSALRREKIKSIHTISDDPKLQYKELHSVRWFCMYAALETLHGDHLPHILKLKWNIQMIALQRGSTRN